MAQGEWGGALDRRIFRANIAFMRGGQKCQTGFFVRDAGLPTLDAEDVAESVLEFATEDFNKLLNGADRLIGVDVLNMETNEGHSISAPVAPGTANGTIAPSFMQVSVALKGSLRKRYASGRMLWPVSVVDMFDKNELTALHRAYFQTVIDALESRYIGQDVTHSMILCHVHKAKPATAKRPALPAMWYDITSVRLNATLSSVRSRRQGNGS